MIAEESEKEISSDRTASDKAEVAPWEASAAYFFIATHGAATNIISVPCILGVRRVHAVLIHVVISV